MLSGLGLFLAFFALTNSAQAAGNLTGTNVVSNGTVYMINAGEREPYTSEGVFLSYGFNTWANVVPATAEDMALPEGDFIPPRDGKIICSTSPADQGTCYLITGAKKAGFTSEEAFKQLGFSFARSLPGDVSFLESAEVINDGTTAHRPGVLVNLNKTIYLIGRNGLIGVPSEAILTSWGYSLADAVVANAADAQLTQRLVLENRWAGELRPFEPTIPSPLTLSQSEKFYLPLEGPKPPAITETWLYSAGERSIHGFVNHGGIDFALPRGTPVYAAADGYAITSTHLSLLDHTYSGKSVGFGLGEFVQIWHPDQEVYTSYSHLSKVSTKIPYFEPDCEDDFCDPKVVYQEPEFSEDEGLFVRRGTLIGYVGDSGLSWGYEEEPQERRPDPDDFPSWDETHLHFEMYTRDTTRFLKSRRYDPFGIYGRLDQYPIAAYSNPNSLWQVDSNGHPVFAK